MEIVDVSKEPAAAGRPRVARRPHAAARRELRIATSKKILVGLVMLACSSSWPSSGPWIAPHDPNALAISPTVTAGTPSARRHHWLGPDQLGRTSGPSCSPAPGRRSSWRSSPASIATVLSIVIGITAGYLGGLVDEVLSLLANMFLVLPALPLLIASAPSSAGADRQPVHRRR